MVQTLSSSTHRGDSMNEIYKDETIQAFTWLVSLPKSYPVRHNLSDIIEVIEDRRTIYPEQFSERKVHVEIIEKMLDAARWAPSHGLTQPWRFSVFTDVAINRLANALCDQYKAFIPAEQFDLGKVEKIQRRTGKTSAMILIGTHYDERGKIPNEEEVIATGMAVQNLMLVAAAYGIGAFWSSPKYIDEPGIHAIAERDDMDRILGVLYLGYPEVEWPKGQRRPTEYFTHWINE